MPPAGLGSLVALWLLGYDLNVISVIGIILLIGIVKKNAIMLVDVALDLERGQSIPAIEAIQRPADCAFGPS